jgi:PP-loop superfamily ATP-utilizing enzyme
VAPDEVARLATLWDDVEPRLRSLGFARVTFDPNGYRRGGADQVARP